MRITIMILALAMLSLCVVASSANRTSANGSIALSRGENAAGTARGKPQPQTLCAKDERIIFSCPVKRPAKIVSVCASKDLTSETGYMQYRFGLPGKVVLEFPKDRKGTQAKFQYTHYFRARVDLTEINFTIEGYEYQVFDTYQGEEKPAVSQQGVSVTAPGKPKEVSLVCRTKPTADYSDLQAVFPNSQ